MNRLSLSATLVEREALRYTPAGIPIVACKVRHESAQAQSEGERSLEFELAVMAADQLARQIDRLMLGTELLLHGFLAPRRRHVKALVLHLTGFEVQPGVGKPASATS